MTRLNYHFQNEVLKSLPSLRFLSFTLHMLERKNQTESNSHSTTVSFISLAQSYRHSKWFVTWEEGQ